MARVGRMVLGLVFVGAGVAKLPAFASFRFSIAEFAGFPPAATLIVACGLIAAELVLGSLLLAGLWVRRSALLAGGLLLLFAVVLTAALVRGVDIPCSCFGYLGPHLQMRSQITLDLALVLLALTIARRRGDFETGLSVARRRKAAGRTILIAGLWSVTVIAWPGEQQRSGRDVPGAVAAYMKIAGQNRGGKQILLLADFADFGCQLCLDDFLALCDSMNRRAMEGKIGLCLVARRDANRAEDVQIRLLKGWAKGNGYAFPVELDRDSLFEKSGVERTSMIAFDGQGGVLMQARFPLGYERRMEVIGDLL